MLTRDTFMQAITENPRDLLARHAFADWLDEHDEPELADFHRNWTVEKYDKAKKYLEEFCDFLDKEGHDDEEEWDRSPSLTIDRLLDTMRKRSEDPDGWAYIGLGFQTPDRCYDERGKLWECYEIITGVKVVEETKEISFFSCGC